MATTTAPEKAAASVENGQKPNARPKLHGRAFYESIGSPQLILAPMVDQSEFVWRLLTRSFLSPEESKNLLAYSPMLHARLFQSQKFREASFQPTRTSSAKPPDPHHAPEDSEIYLDGRKDVDRPLTVQFCSNDPDEFLRSAKYVQPYCDAVDLNLGCPQRIARTGNYGAFLQEDWDLIYRMINNLHVNLSVPITAKIRIQETKEKTLEYAQMILRAGASILTVHGRQRDQKGHKTGLADWSVIRYLRDNLPADTVLFANGNILRHEDLAACLQETGADGVMSAEGNLYNPAIFAPPPAHAFNREYWRGKNGLGGYRVDAVFRRYMSIIYKYVLEHPEPARAPLFVPSDAPTDEWAEEEEKSDEPATKRQKIKTPKIQKKQLSTNLTAMQAHLFHLLRPLVAKRTEVRDALARSRAGNMDAFENVLKLTERAVKDGIIDYEANPEKYDDGYNAREEGRADEGTNGEAQPHTDNITDHESSLRAVRVCRRPWWVAQPYVRPLPKEALEKGSISLSKKEKRELEEMEVERKKAEEEKEKAEAVVEKLGRDTGMSEREKRDVDDGLKKEEVPGQAMVAG